MLLASIFLVLFAGGVGARHFMGLRAAAFVVAGTVRIPFWKFLGVDGAAAMLGVPIGFGLAYFSTDRIEDLMSGVHRVERWIAFFVVVIGVAWLALAMWRRAREVTGRA